MQQTITCRNSCRGNSVMGVVRSIWTSSSTLAIIASLFSIALFCNKQNSAEVLRATEKLDDTQGQELWSHTLADGFGYYCSNACNTASRQDIKTAPSCCETGSQVVYQLLCPVRRSLAGSN